MKRFFKKYGKRILTAAGITAATVIVYLLAHEAATFERGYEAIGGEVLAFTIPLFVWLAPKLKETFKGANKNELD